MGDRGDNPELVSGRISALLAVLLAVFAAALSWWVAAPGFVGRYNDDALYAASAVALAGGQGYVYPFGPETVAASRFPPLFALLLVPAVWAGGGQMVDTVTWMQALTALCTFAFVLAAYWACRAALGLSTAISLAAVAPVALHPVLARYGAAIMADTLAAALGMAALALAAGAEHEISARAAVSSQARLEVPVYAGNAGELLGIAVLPREAPRRSPWERAQLAHWWPVALLVALAILTRYAAGTLLLAILGALALRRRFPEAIGLAGLTAACLLPWGVWAALAGATEYAAQAQQWHLGALPHAFWIGLGYALPGWLIPQVFLAGYPLGAEAGGLAGRLPQNLVGVWGVLVAVSIAGPLWALRKAGSVAAQAAGFYALLALGVALVWSAGFPGMGVDLPARLLLPIAPLVAGSLWLWRAGEHRIARAAAERFKDMAALGWVALVVVFCAVSLGPVRREAERFAQFLPEQWALLAAIGHFSEPGDRIATMRPASLWLYSGRKAVILPLGARDLPAAVRATGARFVVGEPFMLGETDAVREAFGRAAALDPDWARLVYTTPDRRLALFEVH